MRNFLPVAFVLCVLITLNVGAQADLSRVKSSQLHVAKVNPFIGTGGHGHTFPGATVPFGMVQLSPDTRIEGWDACSGYHASDNVILGFSHTHLSGTGIGDYGDILFMPTTGRQSLRQGSESTDGYRSLKTKSSETASPGYYSVHLSDYDVTAELTTTPRAGMHRYSFPAEKSAGVIIDVGHTLQNHRNAVNEIEIINDHEVRGYKVTNGWARDHPVYFYAVFSQPFKSRLASGETLEDATSTAIHKLNAKALLSFEGIDGKQLVVKVGISAVDYAGAKNNVSSEIPGWDFDAVRNAASSAWEQWLARIDVSGGTTDQQVIFYTAMYHTAISPNLATDADGRYRGLDKKTHVAAKGNENYTVFSLWDTFRAFHPLMTIINPAGNEAWIRSMLTKYEQLGVLPMWELASNETGTMIGYNAVPVIVDAYVKGQRHFNIKEAYQAIKHSSTYDTIGVYFPDQEVKSNLMPMGKFYNASLGFVPADKENESVSKALEYAYDDWCIAQMAKALDNRDDYNVFSRRALRYEKYFDRKIRFMRGVNANGTWKTPFNPKYSNHRSDEYVEGNSWQWSWFVPHDISGLIALYGGKTAFIQKLDSLFSMPSEIDGSNSSADISGLIGQYAHGNEPSHHIAYLYDYAGQPRKTQEIADQILNTLYFNNENGLSGNEDCGQMSAWYIMSSMGFYQVTPGDPVYALGRPLFDRVIIHQENGKDFTINAIHNSRERKYASKTTLNGASLAGPFITHKNITDGGTLEFTMTER